MFHPKLFLLLLPLVLSKPKSYLVETEDKNNEDNYIDDGGLPHDRPDSTEYASSNIEAEDDVMEGHAEAGQDYADDVEEIAADNQVDHGRI